MKKQVTFAEKQTIHRLHRQDAASRNLGVNVSETALKDVKSNRGLTIYKPPATSSEPQQLHPTTVQIPKAMTAAPFLKHTALTPAQKEFLYTIAASYSAEHVRSLITRHYMNVLHRCIRTASPENKEPDQSDLPSGSKHKEKISARERKSFLPNIPNRQTRSVSTSTSKHRNMKKKKIKSPQTLRGKSQRGTRISLMEEDDDDEGLEDSLSECLSSLSVGKWDDDDFSDL
ncbi:protein FAM216A isoform X2 [Acanthochromis polyacanthus]|uniref:protein FAM216A isoform X2 n=1 Tax=Acanthochromis polyacanthus TaxID=80966 RepID=UPI0022347A5F|nr:protein FAM216A isoform X2 [Acanthochromis polyacanthus]